MPRCLRAYLSLPPNVSQPVIYKLAYADWLTASTVTLRARQGRRTLGGMTNIAADIGRRLRQLRESRGWSQPYVAQQIGVHLQTVWRWERGERAPNVGDLIEMSRLFGVPFGELAGEDDQMAIPDALSRFFRTPEGRRLSQAQQRGLALLLDGIEDVDDVRLRGALVLLGISE